MEETEAIALLKPLYQMYQHKPLESENVRQQYIKILVKFDTPTAMAALDGLFETMTRCPYPSELFDECTQIVRAKEQSRIIDGIQCFVCEDRGAIVYINDGLATGLYCDQCSKGKGMAYDGRKITDKKLPKTPYYIEPVSKYIDVQELEKINRSRDRTPKPMPHYVRKLMAECTRKLSMKGVG